MDSVRFEPSVSATSAIDRNPSSSGGDLFADMLGDQLKKRTEADRPEAITRRRPQADRPERHIRDDDRPAGGRKPRIVIKPEHDPRDVATTARDVTPEAAALGGCIAGPTEGSVACMDDEAPIEVPVETAQDKDQQTDQPVLVTAVSPAVAPTIVAPAVVVEADPAVVIAIDPQAPALTEDRALADLPEAAASITPAAEPDAAGNEIQPEAAAAPAVPAAEIAASLDAAVLALMAGDDTIGAAASAQILASATPATLAAPKAAAPTSVPAPAAMPEAAAVELAAKITPEAPRPAAEIKARPAARTTPAVELKAQATAHQPPQVPAAAQSAQAITTPAPVAAFGEASFDAFDPAFAGEGATAAGWNLHLAQGAGAKRPDFIAQLRQHLQDLPAHEQVAVNIQRAAREGTGRVTIQLSPAELGKIHVKLEIDEEKRVTAAVTVEKPSTLELLQRDVKALERALQEAGLKMDGGDLSFSLGRHNGEDFGQDMKHAGSAGYRGGADEIPAEADVSAGPAALVDTAAGLVNVQI